MRSTTVLTALVSGALLVVANLLVSYLPGRLDLTEEGRFTLTEATEEVVENIQDPLLVEVLLEGEFPAGFQRLRSSVEELLRDLSDINGRLEYTFTDPNDGDIAEVNKNRELLAKQGINPINFQVRDADGQSDRLLYPYAVVTYRDQTSLVNLLENNIPGQSPEVALNNSVSLLEYKIANAIQKLQRRRKPLIAFTTGHGELTELQTRDLARTLSPYYDVARINLDTMGGFGPEQLGALLVAKPLLPFTEREKFIIDQYVMRGGRVIWMVEKLRVNLDSLRVRPGSFIPPDSDLNLDDLLFRYGFRVEPNLVLDAQSTRVPLVVGQVGNAPQFDLRPWPYHVLANPNPAHPITRALQPVNLFFASEIDTTVRTKTSIDNTVLLATTGNSTVRLSPVRVDLESARYDLKPDDFTGGPYPLAVLAEGVFPSLYENKLGSDFAAALAEIGQDFIAESAPTKMIVITDGDVAKNQIDPVRNAFKPLGLNPFDQYVFDNKDFLVNAIEYLFDTDGIVAARNREVKLRLLDAARARAEERYWQTLNVVAPLVLLALFGVAYNYLRRRRFARV